VVLDPAEAPDPAEALALAEALDQAEVLDQEAILVQVECMKALLELVMMMKVLKCMPTFSSSNMYILCFEFCFFICFSTFVLQISCLNLVPPEHKNILIIKEFTVYT